MSEETKDQVETSEASAADEAASQPEAEPAAPEAKADEAKADEAKAEAADQSKTSVQQSEDDDAVLDATGRERPRFLLGFPQHPELARLAAAFEAGNYAVVRADAEALAERTDNPAVRDAALELRRRIDPDPLAKYLLALTAALLLFLSYFAYHH